MELPTFETATHTIVDEPKPNRISDPLRTSWHDGDIVCTEIADDGPTLDIGSVRERSENNASRLVRLSVEEGTRGFGVYAQLTEALATAHNVILFPPTLLNWPCN